MLLRCSCVLLLIDTTVVLDRFDWQRHGTDTDTDTDTGIGTHTGPLISNTSAISSSTGASTLRSPPLAIGVRLNFRLSSENCPSSSASPPPALPLFDRSPLSSPTPDCRPQGH